MFAIDAQLKEILTRFSHLPRFDDGRIDYSSSSTAPVITCFVRFNGRILLLKRSDKVRAYQGRWNALAGYLDEDVPMRDKVLEELREELGINEEQVSSITIRGLFNVHDDGTNKTWMAFPVLIELKEEPKITLDWEHTEYQWIKPEDITNYDIVPHLYENMKKALGESE